MHLTVTGPGPEARVWLLDVYTAADTKKPALVETCRGDAELDRTMKRHEADQAVVRLAARLA